MTPTLVWFSGFEWGLSPLSANGTGLLNTVGGTTANVGCYSSTARTGSYSLRTYSAGTAGTAYGGWYIGNSGYPIAVISFYFRFTVLPSANTRLMRFTLGSGLVPCLWFKQSDGKFYIGWGTNLSQASSITPTTGVWYRFDMKIDATNNPNTFNWKIDGTDQTGDNYAQAASYPNYLYLGHQDTCTCEILYDDFAYSRTSGDYPIGEVKVTALRPNVDTTSNYGTATMEDASGNDLDGESWSAFNNIDDNPWTGSDTDYVRQATADTSAYAAVDFADYSAGVPQAVMAYLMYNSSSTATNQGACIILSNTTQTEVWGNPTTRADYSESSRFYKRALVSPDGGSWSDAKVDALVGKIGYSNDVVPLPQWRALMLEVLALGAQTYQQSVSGAISSGNLAGALAKQTARLLEGGILSSIVQRAYLYKQTNRTLTALMTQLGTHGFGGTLTYAKIFLRDLAGAISPSATLSRILTLKRTITGAFTPTGEKEDTTFYSNAGRTRGVLYTVGVVSKQTSRTLAGLFQSSYIVGQLSRTLSLVRDISGAISPAATLLGEKIAGVIQKLLEATLTFQGDLSRAASLFRTLDGAITPSATLAGLRTFLRNLAGAISPSGDLTRIAAFTKALAGALTPTGGLVRQIARKLAGALSFVGNVIKLDIKTLQGTIAPTGQLIRQAGKALSGAIAPVGDITRGITRLISGAITAAATLVGQLIAQFVGTKVLRLPRRDIMLTLDQTRPFTLRLTKMISSKNALRLAIRNVILRLPPKRRD